jgi:hypothetical protein
MFGMDTTSLPSPLREPNHIRIRSRIKFKLGDSGTAFGTTEQWSPGSVSSSSSVRACTLLSIQPTPATSAPRHPLVPRRPNVPLQRHVAAAAPDESAETVTKAKTPLLLFPFPTNPQILRSYRDATPTGAARAPRRRRQSARLQHKVYAPPASPSRRLSPLALDRRRAVYALAKSFGAPVGLYGEPSFLARLRFRQEYPTPTRSQRGRSMRA